ncbi:MAG: hypothetical protein IKA90_04395, partial [Clostridia bacterium]|nr:hypothetical protein [Clostridia bacterium]
MDEKIFNNLVNADFVADYEQKYAQIGTAEEKAIADGIVAEELCEQEVANVTNTMETFKLIVMEKLQVIEEKTQQELANAQEKHQADIKQCENRINSAQKAFAKASKENNTKNTKIKNANAKAVAEIEKRYKAEITVAEKKKKEVIKKREKDFKNQADVMAKRHEEAKNVYEHSVTNINAKIKKSHDYYKKQEASSVSAFESVKVVCEQTMQELQEQYNVAQNDFNEQIKNVTEKQRIKTLRTQLALAKSSYESGMAAKKGELATAQKIYSIQHNDCFSQLVKDVTEYQKQLRSLEANYKLDKIELDYEQKIADAENKHRILEEDYAHNEVVLEIDLVRQDELNKQSSAEFCSDYDMEICQKEAQLALDVALEEEYKNIDIAKLNFEIHKKEIETDKLILDGEQQKYLAQNEAKTVAEINKKKENVHHTKQIGDVNVYSLSFKNANKNQKLINCIKWNRNVKSFEQQIESVNQRLANDLVFIEQLKQYQLAELEAINKTTADFYDKQAQAIQKLYDEAVALENENEASVFKKSLEDIYADRQTAFDQLSSQAKFIDDMIFAEENRVKEQAQKELDALELFIKEFGDMTEKYNVSADELRTKTDEAKKDAVVNLLALHENQNDNYDRECECAVRQFEKDFVTFSKAKIVERETFIQEIEDKKIAVAEDYAKKQDQLRERLQHFVNEAEKNKSISKGMLGEQLCRSFDKRQDKKVENAQFLTQKANELKAFENSCQRA